MHTHIQRGTAIIGRFMVRLMDVPVLREFIGAASGCAVALALYGVFEFGRHVLGGGSVDVLAPLHASAAAVAANGAVSLALPCTLALAGGCAFVHRRCMSEID